MTLASQLLTKIAGARQGMTMPELYGKFEDYENTIKALHASICAQVKRGRLRKDGSRECGCCGQSHVVYRITDRGREILQ